MFGRKKMHDDDGRETSKRKGAELMSQMGFGPMAGLGDIDALVYGDDDDSDLEAELAALAGDTSDDVDNTRTNEKRANMPITDLEEMAASGMEDIDEEVSDTEDPALLAELQDLENENDEDEPSIRGLPINSSKATTPAKILSTAPEMIEPTLSSTSIGPVPAPRSLPSSQGASAPTLAPVATVFSGPVPSLCPKSSATGSNNIISLLQERMKLYEQVSTNAKKAGDSSKQRRLDRGIKTMASLLKQAKAGKPVNEEEIPPLVALGTSASVPESTSDGARNAELTSSFPGVHAPSLECPSSDVTSTSVGASPDTKQVLLTRRDQYRKAALLAKQTGDMTKAGTYIKFAKQFDIVIVAVDEGKPVDLSKMPPIPPEFSGEALKTGKKPQTSLMVLQTNQTAGEDADLDLPTATAEEEKSIFNAPDAPQTVMEALTQRLEKYKASESSAKADGEGSKARRMGRIVKQYEDAIRLYKAGKQVAFDELPTPPGFSSIPVDRMSSVASTEPSSQSAPANADHPMSTSTSASMPAAAPRTAASGASKPAQITSQAKPMAVIPRKIQRQNTGRKSLHSRQEQQLTFLKERMEEFKQAAINAKKNHDIELAKKYIRMMKGMEPMVEACESGLPVDLSQVPPSPVNSDDAEHKFVIVSAEDCQPTGDREEVFKNLHADLVRQIKICITNAQHYQRMGDVPAAARFQKLEQNNRRDLESLKSAHRHGDPAPRFHYETRTFSMVQCNTELGDSDMELTVVRGIQYNLPSGYSEKDMDTYVKYELAFPTDEAQTGCTGTVKDTVNPDYSETFRLQINRKSKGLFRFVERKGLKLDVFIKRGFFKGDKLLGTVQVKLQALETKCMIHESFDLMDGRKSIGGKLEVKIRIRDPLKSKQVDEVKEKWLVLDQFIRTVGSGSQTEAKASKSRSEGILCMEVLRLEKQMLDKQILQLKDSLSVTQTQALRHKSAFLEEKIELQQKKLREGGIGAWKAYLATVKSEAVGFEQEARQYFKLGEVQKAELLMNKRKCAEKEIAAIKAKMPDA